MAPWRRRWANKNMMGTCYSEREQINDHEEYEFSWAKMRGKKWSKLMKSVVVESLMGKNIERWWKISGAMEKTLRYEECESCWGSLASLSVLLKLVARLDCPSLFPLRSLGHKSLGAAARKESLFQSSKWFIIDSVYSQWKHGSTITQQTPGVVKDDLWPIKTISSLYHWFLQWAKPKLWQQTLKKTIYGESFWRPYGAVQHGFFFVFF